MDDQKMTIRTSLYLMIENDSAIMEILANNSLLRKKILDALEEVENAD